LFLRINVALLKERLQGQYSKAITGSVKPYLKPKPYIVFLWVEFSNFVAFSYFWLFFGRVVVSLLFIPSLRFPDSEGTELNFDLI